VVAVEAAAEVEAAAVVVAEAGAVVVAAAEAVEAAVEAAAEVVLLQLQVLPRPAPHQLGIARQGQAQ
jgi:hypothetical protein